jgi:gliding motility-associated-like protein
MNFVKQKVRKFNFRMMVAALLMLTSLLSFNAQASHYMGGEITWECIPAGQPNAGKYIFTMKVYRECAGIQFGNTQTLSSTSPAGSISLTEIAGWPKDISPQCNSNPNFSHITCAGATQSNTGAVQEHIYRSQPIQINGVPPATGWMFYWGSCCRNPSANIVNATSKSFRIRAIMYPYGTQNAYPCFDNSPTFAEVPRTVICTGYPFTYNHNAFDKELDSLTFEWGQPLLSTGSPLSPYTSGYSYLSPLPGTAQNPNNVPATVNPTTGTISFTSYTTGAYVTSTKVTAYKCGVKVAEIWRDMQVVLLSCGTNAPPNVTPPFNNGTSFVDTVFAGDNVCFNMSATDFQFLPNGSPQTMSIEASGPQLGVFVPPSGGSQPTLSPTTGCLNPPCATLTPAPGPNYPLTGVFGVQTQFCWQTDCGHLATNVGCGNTSNVYNFVLKVKDDFCPAPAINISTITIVVLPKPTLPPPQIQCAKVLPNGDVDLTWTPVKDTMNTFDSYRIFTSSNAAGPYTVLDSIYDIKQSTYHHSGANANTAPVYYMMRTLAGCPGNQALSDSTLAASIHLTVNKPNPGTAALSWNPLTNPLLPSSTGWYHVYREYPAGVWTFLDSTQNTSFTDYISLCGDTVNYRVEITDTALFDTLDVQYSCTSISSVDGDSFADNTPPNIPTLDSVSINSSGFVDMSWDYSQAGDIGGFIIYTNINGSWTPIDTIYSDSTITYTDQKNPPCNTAGKYNQYAIASMDTCNNTSLFSIEQRTINVDAVKDICDDKITLTWNSFINMLSGISQYDIYVSENGGPQVLLNSNSATDTTYVHTGLNNGSTYCYTIRARDNSGTRSSTSCTVCQVANKPNQPQFVYIRTATVLPQNNGVLLKIHTDTAGKVSQYRVERYNQDAGSWSQIATLPPNYSNPTLTYLDATALVRQKSYRYRVIVVDSCGIDVLTSKEARTMLLKVTAKNDLTNELKWSAYSGFLGKPMAYEIYRSVDGVWDPVPIVNLPGSQTNFIDNVETMAYTSGVFGYYVHAVEGLSGNPYNFPAPDTSRSNTVEALQKPKLYVPSAFRPESTNPDNRTFYPRGVFINSRDYTFIIFNRWGQEIFLTHEINKGWDGKYEGVDSPQGVYTYYVKFTTSDGREFEKRGTVTLIR